MGCTIDRGSSDMPSYRQFMNIMVGIQRDWLGTEYALTTHNCHNCVNDILERLGQPPLPTWITDPAENLARLEGFLGRISNAVGQFPRSRSSSNASTQISNAS